MKRLAVVLMTILMSLTAIAQGLPAFSPYLQETYYKDKGLRSPQGAAVYWKYLFQFHDQNPAMAVYDLETKTLVGDIQMTAVKTYHCNNVEFSNHYYNTGDEFPVVYASMENIAEHCAIGYRISRASDGSFLARQVQKIVFPDPLEMGVYFPNIAIDNDEGCIYVTGYSKNSWNKAESGNAIQILKFRMPDPYRNEVVLSTADIIGRSVYDFRIATQGATIRNGLLYQVYGVPSYGPCSICCFNLSEGVKVWEKDLAAAGIAEEPESLDFYNNEIFVVSVNGTVYSGGYKID